MISITLIDEFTNRDSCLSILRLWNVSPDSRRGVEIAEPGARMVLERNQIGLFMKKARQLHE